MSFRRMLGECWAKVWRLLILINMHISFSANVLRTLGEYMATNSANVWRMFAEHSPTNCNAPYRPIATYAYYYMGLFTLTGANASHAKWIFKCILSWPVSLVTAVHYFYFIFTNSDTIWFTVHLIILLFNDGGAMGVMYVTKIFLFMRNDQT